MNVWHARLGNTGQQRIQWLAQRGLLFNIPHVELSTCASCLHKKPPERRHLELNFLSN